MANYKAGKEQELDNFLVKRQKLIKSYFAENSVYTQKRYNCSGLLKTTLNNVLYANIVRCCQQYCSALLHLIAG